MKYFSRQIFFCVCFVAAMNLRADVPDNSANPALKQIAPGIFQLGGVRLNLEKKTVQFPASINMTNGAVEYFLVNGIGKLHESVLKTETEPAQIHMAMLFLGAKGALKSSSTNVVPEEKFIANAGTNKIGGDEIAIEVSWKNGDSEKRVRAEDLVLNTETKLPMSKGVWVYNGSKVVNGTFIAQRDGSIVSIITDDLALVNNTRRGHENDQIWIVNTNAIPPQNTSVEVTVKLELPRKNAENTK
jgi:hypothetical protein